MIVGFSKLFADIIHSTVWREPMHVKVVWITMLAMSDRHGQVLASIPGLADSAKVSMDECLEALQVFLSPDEYSRTKDYEGRRIAEIDGGWLLLNYEKFRERRDDEEQRIQTRERVRRFREKAKAVSNVVTENVTETQSNDIQKQNTDTEQKKNSAIAPSELVFDYWKDTLKHSQTKLDAKRRNLITARLKTFSVAQLCQAIDGCKTSAWHQGKNPSGKIYDKISLIFRDDEMVEQFISYTSAVPHRDTKTYSTPDERRSLLLPAIP